MRKARLALCCGRVGTPFAQTPASRPSSEEKRRLPRACAGGGSGGGAERPQPRALVVGRLSWGLGAQGGLVAEWAPLGFPAGGGHLHISCLMSS